MTYGQAYLSGWKETFNFSGRASRQQFWTFFLINVLIAAAPVSYTHLRQRSGVAGYLDHHAVDPAGQPRYLSVS